MIAMRAVTCTRPLVVLAPGQGLARKKTRAHQNATGRVPQRVAAGGPAGGWFDLANFVATSSSNKTPFDDFAASIGKDIYIDVLGWHLFLRDVKLTGADQSLAQALATKIGSDMMSTCDA